MSAPHHILYGIPVAEIARICCVDLATARRWKRGATCPPKTAVMILAADLGAFDPAWGGWTLRAGQILSPEGWAATPGEILGIPLLRMQVQNYQLQERIVERMDEQPFHPAEVQIKA